MSACSFLCLPSLGSRNAGGNLPYAAKICGNNAQDATPILAAKVAAEEIRGSTRGAGVGTAGWWAGGQQSDDKQADRQATPDARSHVELAKCEAQDTEYPAVSMKARPRMWSWHGRILGR